MELNNPILRLKGRLDYCEQNQGSHYHNITVPAHDAYSKPQSFKFKANQQLGNIGQEIEVFLKVSGFVQQKNWTDPKTGQNRSFQDGKVFFEVCPPPVTGKA